jgi:endonuclease/exonuclease/phosphatase family metal-dependent hydrolase
MLDATLVCWNVAGRLRRQAQQAAHVIALSPDIVCLQEVIARAVRPWSESLAAAGLCDVRVADVTAAVGRDRPLLTLVASRWEQEPIAAAGVPWPERVLATRLASLEVIDVHSPISPKPRLAKVLTHEAVHAHLSAGRGPRLVCGDFNTPRREHPDGRVWTFARDRYGRLRADRGERWDAAELALIEGWRSTSFATPSGLCTASSSANQAGCGNALAAATDSTTSSSPPKSRSQSAATSTNGVRRVCRNHSPLVAHIRWSARDASPATPSAVHREPSSTNPFAHPCVPRASASLGPVVATGSCEEQRLVESAASVTNAPRDRDRPYPPKAAPSTKPASHGDRPPDACSTCQTGAGTV